MSRVAQCFLIALLSCICLSACKKWVIDYRNKFTGSYIFEVKSYSWDGNNWVTENYETDGEIYYLPFKNFGKSITIQISPQPPFKADVDRNGNLSEDCDIFVQGTISDDLISYTASSKGKCTTAKGPATSYTVTGRRK